MLSRKSKKSSASTLSTIFYRARDALSKPNVSSSTYPSQETTTATTSQSGTAGDTDNNNNLNNDSSPDYNNTFQYSVSPTLPYPQLPSSPVSLPLSLPDTSASSTPETAPAPLPTPATPVTPATPLSPSSATNNNSNNTTNSPSSSPSLPSLPPITTTTPIDTNPPTSISTSQSPTDNNNTPPLSLQTQHQQPPVSAPAPAPAPQPSFSSHSHSQSLSAAAVFTTSLSPNNSSQCIPSPTISEPADSHPFKRESPLPTPTIQSSSVPSASTVLDNSNHTTNNHRSTNASVPSNTANIYANVNTQSTNSSSSSSNERSHSHSASYTSMQRFWKRGRRRSLHPSVMSLKPTWFSRKSTLNPTELSSTSNNSNSNSNNNNNSNSDCNNTNNNNNAQIRSPPGRLPGTHPTFSRSVDDISNTSWSSHRNNPSNYVSPQISNSHKKPSAFSITSLRGSWVKVNDDDFDLYNNNNNNNNNDNDNDNKESLMNFPAFGVPITSLVPWNNNINVSDLYNSSFVPVIVDRCLVEIEKRGLQEEGLYRVSGQKTIVDKLKSQFNNTAPYNVEIAKAEVHDLTSLLKSWFRELPEPLVPFDFYDEFISLASNPDPEERINLLGPALATLPSPHLALLCRFLGHLAKVTSNSNKNSMTSQNLSLIFAPTLLQPRNSSNSFAISMQNIGIVSKLLVLLIDNHEQVLEKVASCLASTSIQEEQELELELDEQQQERPTSSSSSSSSSVSGSSSSSSQETSTFTEIHKSIPCENNSLASGSTPKSSMDATFPSNELPSEMFFVLSRQRLRGATAPPDSLDIPKRSSSKRRALRRNRGTTINNYNYNDQQDGQDDNDDDDDNVNYANYGYGYDDTIVNNNHVYQSRRRSLSTPASLYLQGTMTSSTALERIRESLTSNLDNLDQQQEQDEEEEECANNDPDPKDSSVSPSLAENELIIPQQLSATLSVSSSPPIEQAPKQSISDESDTTIVKEGGGSGSGSSIRDRFDFDYNTGNAYTNDDNDNLESLRRDERRSCSPSLFNPRTTSASASSSSGLGLEKGVRRSRSTSVNYHSAAPSPKRLSLGNESRSSRPASIIFDRLNEMRCSEDSVGDRPLSFHSALSAH